MITTDESGVELHLGKEVARGGEGAIHMIPSRPGSLAKLYLHPPAADRIAKLRAMIANPLPSQKDTIAWPSGLLLRGNAVVGFVMPFARDRQDINALYTGVGRRRHFPAAGYRMMVATAANLSSTSSQWF
jgi:DNA-binding helix-hairpin-helix protein with protein kinase domain